MFDFTKAEDPPKEQKNSFISLLMGSMYPGITLFARDVNLPPELAEKYKAGMIIREKGFTDTTIRFGGMVTSCRYVILSNHMKNLAMLENGTNWGLHVANKDAHFKVLGQVTYKGKTGIFLLHLPDDETWKAYQTMEFSGKGPGCADSGAGCQGVAGSLSVSGRNERWGTVLASGGASGTVAGSGDADLSACFCQGG